MTIGTPITTPDNTHGKIERTSTETGCLLVRITDETGHQGWFVAKECERVSQWRPLASPAGRI